MKLWILSDLHADQWVVDIAVDPPVFDVLVCAGDMLTGDIAGSIEMTAAIARGKPAVFVAGNHEWMGAADPDEVVEEGSAVAKREGVHWLERSSVVVTHFEPTPTALVVVRPRTWICGHHHGHFDRTIGRTRIVRNAGHAAETVDGEPARPGYVVEI